MPVLQCPSREELFDFSVGKLSEETLTEIGRHLETCAACQSTIQEIDDTHDTFARQLRLPVSANAFESEPECQHAVALVEAIGRDPSFVGSQSLDEPLAEPIEVEFIRDYQLLTKLGEGGMGAVYKAMHTKLKKVVALKLLPGERMSDTDAVARFQREMEAVGKLDHPNIVRATDAGEFEGKHFLVMELVEGLDLSKLVRRVGPLSIPDACELVRQAAVGLQHAHEHVLVHRDIKPSNLILAEDGTVKILDLGVARLRSDQPGTGSLTAAGQIIGTADYMAPEQYDDTRTVDIRADLYSLGCTLYELLTGQPPFSGSEYRNIFQKMKAHCEAPAPAVIATRRDVPEQLASIVHRLLAKDRSERFSTPAEVVEALEPFTAGNNLPDLLKQAREHEETEIEQVKTRPSTASPISSAVSDTYIAEQQEEFAADQARPARSPRRRRLLIVILSAAAAAIVLLGIVLVLRTPNGEVVVELGEGVMAKDVKIEVRGDGALYVADGKSGWSIEVKAGRYEVQLVGSSDRLQVDRDTVTVTRGGQQRVRVTLRPLYPAWKPTPVQQAFIDDVATLLAAKQALAVVKKLQELNPDFDGKHKHKIEYGMVTDLEFNTDHVAEIWPVRALPKLRSLTCTGTHDGSQSSLGILSDLSPLKGMPLTELDFQDTQVSDLSALEGMRLCRLYCNSTPVSDLGPLKGMPLKLLNIDNTPVSELSVLEGMPLTELWCSRTRVSDLSPLKGMPLTELDFQHTQVSDLTPLEGMQLCRLYCNNTPVSDLAPLVGMPLLRLECTSMPVSDLSPLKGMPLKVLNVDSTRVSDLSPLQGMGLQVLYCRDTQVSDLSPLRDMRRLTELRCCRTRVSDLSPLKGMPLRELHFERTQVSDLSALAGMPLKVLNIDRTPVSDLSPVKSLPVKELTCTEDIALRNAPILREMKSLATINSRPAAEFWKTPRKPTIRDITPVRK